MRAAALACPGLVLASQANALSCLRPDVARSFLEAEASDAVYSFVRGVFEFDPLTLSLGGVATKSMPIPAVFSDRVPGPDGFMPTEPHRVVLQIECDETISTCGSIRPETDSLASLRHGEEELILQLGACPQWLFPDPTAGSAWRDCRMHDGR